MSDAPPDAGPAMSTPHTAGGTPAPTGPGGWDAGSKVPAGGPQPGQTLSDRILTAAAGTGLPDGGRGSADPVKLLLHRHRPLCEQAVDPLEIAAGLEAYGITDRTAARFRHRDVFSLAEELYARAPRAADSAADEKREYPAAGTRAPGRTSTGPSGRRSGRRTDWSGWTAVSLLPGIVCALTLLGLGRTSGQTQLAIGLAGFLTLPAVLSSCLHRGPLHAAGRRVPAAGLWMYWLLTYLVCGEGLLRQLVTGGPHGTWPATLTPVLALASAVPLAAWCHRLFSQLARRRLKDSAGLADFTAVTRPLLLALVGVYAAALTGLAQLAGLTFGDGGALAPVVTLGTLLLLARLLTVHGFPEPAATGLAAACAAEALACLSVLAGRVPGCAALGVPVTELVVAGGPAAVPALACGAAALGLLVHAFFVLSRASAHT